MTDAERIADLEAKLAEAERKLKNYLGPAAGNEPVAERDALLAQLAEAEAREKALRDENKALRQAALNGSWFARSLDGKPCWCDEPRGKDEHRSWCEDMRAALAAGKTRP